jgi:hypothetical protein
MVRNKYPELRLKLSMARNINSGHVSHTQRNKDRIWVGIALAMARGKYSVHARPSKKKKHLIYYDSFHLI